MSSSPTESSAPAASGGSPVPVQSASPSTPAPAPRVPLFSAEAWSPLKVQLFRSLYIATSIAQIGTWVREAGGPILMSTLTEGRIDRPAMVAKVLTYSNLPICLFSVFAGALADVLDRRRLLIITQAWMLVFSALLGVLTVTGHITPWGLLGLTFVVATGTAAAGPALQALLPELVPKKDLPLAINLNSVALNVARALGPALFIVVITIFQKARPGIGIGASFFVTAASFIWAIWVLFQWKREPQRAAVHGEGMWGAIRAGFLYTIHSPANRAILLRVLAFIVPAVVMWSQIPIIATGLLGAKKGTELQVSALLFAFVGLGAIVGVLVMPGLQKRYKIDPVVNVCTALFAGGLIGLSFIHHLVVALPIMIFLGINWVIIPTNFNTATQTSVPLWVKGRAISFYLTVLFGSFAIGGAIWGRLTTLFTTPAHSGINASLIIGGIMMGSLLALAKKFPLTLNQGLDLGAAFAGAPPKPVFPDIVPPPDPVSGPVPVTDAAPAGLDPKANPRINGPIQVSLQYNVDSTRVAEFLAVMNRVGEQRRRNGASAWRLEPASSASNGSVSYSEVIRYRSQGELTRQPARMTKSDLSLLDQARAFHNGTGELPGKSEVLTGDDADPYAPLKKWAAQKLSESFDRFFDETAGAFDRFGAMHERERKSRQVKWREIRIRVPE